MMLQRVHTSHFWRYDFDLSEAACSLINVIARPEARRFRYQICTILAQT